MREFMFGNFYDGIGVGGWVGPADEKDVTEKNMKNGSLYMFLAHEMMGNGSRRTPVASSAGDCDDHFGSFTGPSVGLHAPS